MTDTEDRRVPWFLSPSYALWRLLTFILNATGRLVLAVLGIALMVVEVVPVEEHLVPLFEEPQVDLVRDPPLFARI